MIHRSIQRKNKNGNSISLTQPMDPEKKSLNFIFPTKYVIPKSLKFNHWPSKIISKPLRSSTNRPLFPGLRSRCFRTRPAVRSRRVVGGCRGRSRNHCFVKVVAKQKSAEFEFLHQKSERFTKITFYTFNGFNFNSCLAPTRVFQCLWYD